MSLPAHVASHPAMLEFAACLERPRTLGRLIAEVSVRYADRQAIARACPNFAITVLVDGAVVFDPDRQ